MPPQTEMGRVVQYKMILKATKGGGGTLRVNAHHHAESRMSHARADAGVPSGQRRAGFHSVGPRRDLQSGRAYAWQAAVSRVAQERQRGRAPLFKQAERTQSAADHSPDSAVSPKRRGAAAAAAAAAFPHPLHARRHRLAGSGRRGARRALGPGGAAHSVAGILRLPQGGLSAAGLDLFLPTSTTCGAGRPIASTMSITPRPAPAP